MKAKSPKAPVTIPSELRPVVLQLIQQAPQPIKPAALAKSPELPKKVTGKMVQEFLAADLDSGRMFNWGSDKTPAYWHRGKETEARNRLVNIASENLLNEKTLTARCAAELPKIPAAAVKAAFTALKKEDRLRTLDKLVVDLNHPLLKLIGKPLPSGLARALLSDQPPATSETTVAEVAEKIFSAMNRIAFSPGATVTFYRLREQPELTPIPKPIFDQAALLLQAQRKAILAVHDHAAGLPAAERERFVTDGSGTYYVSIYAR